MNREEAVAYVGKMVMTTHAGWKMITHGPKHGPYLLLKVTKAGTCILEGYEEHRPSPKQISLA